jgi:hypothetical protein
MAGLLQKGPSAAAPPADARALPRPRAPQLLDTLLLSGLQAAHLECVALLLTQRAALDTPVSLDALLLAAMSAFPAHRGNAEREEAALGCVRAVVAAAPGLVERAGGADALLARAGRLPAQESARLRAALAPRHPLLSPALLRAVTKALLIALLAVAVAAYLGRSGGGGAGAEAGRGASAPARAAPARAAPARAAPAAPKPAAKAKAAKPAATPAPAPPPPATASSLARAPAPAAAPPAAAPAPSAAADDADVGAGADVALLRRGSGLFSWLRGKDSRAAQERWLRRFGMERDIGTLQRARKLLADAEAAEAQAGKRAAAAAASVDAAAAAARKAGEAKASANEKQNFGAAAKHLAAEQRAAADATRAEGDLTVANRAAAEAADTVAQRRAKLEEAEVMVARLEFSHASMAVFAQTDRVIKLRADLARAVAAEMFQSAQAHAEALAAAESYKAELLARYAIEDPAAPGGLYDQRRRQLGLPEAPRAPPADAKGRRSGAAAAEASAADLAVEAALVELKTRRGGGAEPGGAAGAKAGGATAVRDAKVLSQLQLETEIKERDAQRAAAASAAATAKRLGAEAAALQGKAKASRAAAETARAAIEAAKARDDMAAAASHQARHRAAAADADTAAAAAEAAARDRDKALDDAAAAAATLAGTERKLAELELDQAKDRSALLQVQIDAVHDAYEVFKKADDFEMASPLQAQLKELRATRAALVAAFGLPHREERAAMAHLAALPER